MSENETEAPTEETQFGMEGELSAGQGKRRKIPGGELNGYTAFIIHSTNMFTKRQHFDVGTSLSSQPSK
jgi:hypothetical protein